MSAILEIKKLFGGYIPELDILQGIDLALEYGETVGIIGLNGSGKSTLGKAVMNMLPHRKGEIYFERNSVTVLSTSELAHCGIAIMQQGGQVFQNLSIWENLQLAFGENPDKEYVNQLSLLIPLLAAPKLTLRSKTADKLSGGQRHQLALAMTLARQPRLVVLDEPSAGLSPRSVDQMYEILNEMRKVLGVTILLIEQNINKAVGFCDRCLLLQQGTIAHELRDGNLAAIENMMFNN